MPQPNTDLVNGFTRPTACYPISLPVFTQDNPACRHRFGAVQRHSQDDTKKDGETA
jgi:hypothetical protein